MTWAEIETVLSKLPLLGDSGMGVFDPGRRLSSKERQEQLEAEKKALLESSEACARVCEWLADLKPIKTINRRYSSYDLKHLAEPEIGYVTNGAFIAAAIHCGFTYATLPESLNVYFGISEKTIKAKQRARRAKG
jgi:hypothetical protein